MTLTLDDLVAILDLAPQGADHFTGHSPAVGWRRIFGGLVVAQALVAAARTAGGRPVHALHGDFILPGDPEEPIDYAVERLRDGGSFTTRRCVARQHGRAIFALSASFHAPEADAFDHAMPMPDVPRPDDLPGPDEIRSGRAGDPLPPAQRSYLGRGVPIELRPVDLDRYRQRDPCPVAAQQALWMRAAGSLPGDPVLHAAVLAYMSDMTLLDASLAPHGRSVFDHDMQAASLDHAIWFHRSLRADDWLLYVAESPSAAGARGFARGSIFDAGGRLVASVAQEGLIRRRTRP